MRLLALVLLLGLVVGVSAQTISKDPTPTTDKQPSYDAENPNRFNCETLAAKHWMAATDPGLNATMRDYHEHAALAYEHLATLAWPC